tara:strand:- start:2 stop:355 length:354 start_codon:yes stop_codon:yes gene_type:complete
MKFKNSLFVLLFFPFFCFPSFPIISSVQINDTIINSETSVKIEVDSLNKYPLEKETLAEYKQRLKKVMNSNNSSSTSKTFTWKKVRIILLIFCMVLVLLVVLYARALNNLTLSFSKV